MSQGEEHGQISPSLWNGIISATQSQADIEAQRRRERLGKMVKKAGVELEGKFIRAADLPPEQYGSRRNRRAMIARSKRAG